MQCMVKQGNPVFITEEPIMNKRFPEREAGCLVVKAGCLVVKTGFPVIKTGFSVMRTGFPLRIISKEININHEPSN